MITVIRIALIAGSVPQVPPLVWHAPQTSPWDWVKVQTLIIGFDRNLLLYSSASLIITYWRLLAVSGLRLSDSSTMSAVQVYLPSTSQLLNSGNNVADFHDTPSRASDTSAYVRYWRLAEIDSQSLISQARQSASFDPLISSQTSVSTYDFHRSLWRSWLRDSCSIARAVPFPHHTCGVIREYLFEWFPSLLSSYLICSINSNIIYLDMIYYSEITMSIHQSVRGWQDAPLRHLELRMFLNCWWWSLWSC